MDGDFDRETSPAAPGPPHFPRNDGPLPDADGHARITGPCGETMEFWLCIRDGTIERASFLSDGCGSSHACGSVAAFLVETEPVTTAVEMGQENVLAFLGDVLPPESAHCALLAADTVRAACEDYLAKAGPSP